jgi:hypothetical protein
MSVEEWIMVKMSTQHEITLAQDSVRALRSAISAVHRGSVGSKAQAESSRLTAHVKATAVTVDAIRGNSFNPTVQQIVQEHDRLKKTADAIVRDLAGVVKYVGPVRSRMSLREKSDFISQNGAEKFFSLPE